MSVVQYIARAAGGDHNYHTDDVLNTGSMACGNGRPVEVTASTGTIESPGYDDSTYPNDAHCQWLITAPSGEVSSIC